MSVVIRSPNEQARLATLRALGLMDGPRDPVFDDLTRLAADLLDVPVAMVTLADDARLWVGAAVGIAATELPRDRSFCEHALAREGVVEVRDAREDPRFRDGALVVGEAGVRFYAGVALWVDGLAMGTLCVMDREPRRLDARQKATLERLGGMAARHLVLRRDAMAEALSRRRLSDFLVSSGDWAWETEGLRVNWVSDNIRGVLGVDPTAYRGHLLIEGLLDDDEQVRAVNATALAAVRAQQPFRDLVVRRTIDDREQVVVKSGVPLRLDDGRFVGWRGISRVVTESHQARRAAALAERRLREAVEALAEPFVMTDPEDRIVLTNARWRAANLDPGQPVPETWAGHLRRIIDSGRLEGVRGREAEWIRARAERRANGGDAMEIRVGGTDFLVRDIRLSDGSCVTVGEDITAIRAEQRAALDAIHRLGLAVSAAGMLVCEASLDTDELRVVAGVPIADGGQPMPPLLSSALLRIVPGERERFEAGVRDVWEGRREVLKEELTVDRGGTLRRLRFDVTLQPETPHRPRRLIGVRTDMTALRRAEHDARQKTAADLANRAKSEFLSRVGHELRTPLNAIRGLAQVLQREAPDGDAPRPAMVGHIVTASEHLAALLDDLLEMSQIESGRVRIRSAPMPLAATMRDCLRMIAPQAAGHGIALECGRVPDGLQVMADPTRLRQILLNLVSNAVKYNRPQGRVRLDAAVDPRDGFATISVTDTGPGLAREDLDRVFRPFERIRRGDGVDVEGLGLGLSIAQGLAQAMGGAIEVDSRLGHGTTFTVRVPAVPEDGSADAGVPEEAADAQALGSGRPCRDASCESGQDCDGPHRDPLEERAPDAGSLAPAPSAGAAGPGRPVPRRVLYVEDNRLNGVLMKQIALQVPGLVLQVVESGEEALATLERFSPDLLLLDNDLPGISGLQVQERLRGDPRWAALPVVLVSADATPDGIARARACGFHDYWVKPLDVSRVIEAFGGSPGRERSGSATGA